MTVRRFFIMLGVLALVVIVAAAVVHTTVIPWLIHRQEAVLVPDFAGLTLEDAETEARRVGLGVEVGEEVFLEGTPPGTVIEHFPGPLRSVRQGRSVRLTMSKGEALGRVPELVGMSLRQAEITLMREDLHVGRVARSYDPMGDLGIAAQRPHPGAEVQRGSSVDLLLREEHERPHYMVPVLLGRNLVRVREELSRAGFELRRITYRADGDAFPGTILEQWPTAGARIPQGGSVELVASTRN